jgi:hypothetical protein
VDSHALVSEQIDAAAELVERFDKFMPVKVAFWLKPEDSESWLLYIAGERVAQEGIAPGNREIVRICQQINSPYLDVFQVRLISDDHPLAKSVLQVHQRYPGKFPIRYGGTVLGGTSIEGAYLPATSGPSESLALRHVRSLLRGFR